MQENWHFRTEQNRTLVVSQNPNRTEPFFQIVDKNPNRTLVVLKLEQNRIRAMMVLSHLYSARRQLLRNDEPGSCPIAESRVVSETERKWSNGVIKRPQRRPRYAISVMLSAVSHQNYSVVADRQSLCYKNANADIFISTPTSTK